MRDDTRKFFEKLAGAVEEEREEARHIELEAVKEEKEYEPELVKARATAMVEKSAEAEDIFDDGEGQLAIDVYQTENDIVIESAVAGVGMDNLDIEISPESVTVRGKREKVNKTEKRDYLFQECYWGKFSRSVILPQEINPDNANASFKNGILRIILPKVDKKKAKKVKVRFE